MGDIVLSAGVRQNLLSLQSTAQLMSVTQNRLATGKKVNSALDNPANFFTSQSLNNRARDLNALLDSIGQAQQTLSAADKGLSALTKLVESAKSIAKSARQSPQPTSTTFGQITVTGTPLGETIAGPSAGTAAVVASNATTYSFVIDVNGSGATTVTYLSSAGATTTEIATGLTDSLNTFAATTTAGANAFTVSTDVGGTFALTANTADADFNISANGTGGNSGVALTLGNNVSSSLLDQIIQAGGTAGQSTLTVAVNGGQTQTITFGAAPGQISTKAELNAALSSVSGLVASVGPAVTSFVVASSSVQNNLTLNSTTGVNTALGIAANINQNGALTSTTGSDPTRTSLQADYNDVITAIDQLAKDTGYNGVNLLFGDTLKVVFNENGTSTLSIAGVTFDSTGLGLTAVAGNGFQADATIDTTITSLEAALVKLRAQASKFGSYLNTVQTRQDFTKSLIATLKSGSDDLVLADPNEEGANMLALQTRQQLSTTALSLSAQADQAVLRLFG